MHMTTASGSQSVLYHLNGICTFLRLQIKLKAWFNGIFLIMSISIAISLIVYRLHVFEDWCLLVSDVQFRFVQKLLQEYSQELFCCSTDQLSFLSTVLVKLPKIFVSPSGTMRIMKINGSYEKLWSSQRKTKKETAQKKKHGLHSFQNCDIKLGELSCNFTGT